MKFNIFSDYRVPLIIAILGILIILSDFIQFNSMRKVSLKNRTNIKNKTVLRVLNNYLLKLLNKSDLYVKAIDIIQFNIGYFSAQSEIKNRQNSEKILVRGLSINLIIILMILLYKTLWIAKFLAIFVVFLIEYMLIKTSISKKRQKLKEQFPILVREFIEGYALTNNVKAAFEHIVKEIPPVYQVHVNRLINHLSSTSKVDEAFLYFNNRIGYSMCSSFISIVQSAYSTKRNIIDRLIEFQELLNEEVISNKSKKAKIKTVSNNIALWIIVIVVEIYAAGMVAKTSTGNYFFTTSNGQSLLFFSIISILLALVCIRISESV